MHQIIHIGYPKTATTWFQESYFNNVKNFFYIDKKTTNDILVKPDVYSFSKELARSQLNQLSKGKPMLLSSERLVGTLNRGWHNGYHAKEMALRLKLVFNDPIIVIFIRRQEDMIASAYFQYVKGGGNYSVVKYLSTSSQLFSLQQLNFYNIIKLYCSLFGEKRVKVYLYEDFYNNNMEFLKSFNKDLGLDVALESVDFHPSNVSLPKRLLFLKRIANCFYYRMNPFKHYLFPVRGWDITQEIMFKKLSRSPFRGDKISTDELFSHKFLSLIREFYREPNKKLINEFNLEGILKHNYIL